MAENYLLEHCPNAYILRPPYFFMEFMKTFTVKHFLFDCAEKKAESFYIPQNGDMKLQFYNVSDLCKFIELIIKKKPDNHIYNVGNSDIITVKEWVKLCYKAVGKKYLNL